MKQFSFLDRPHFFKKIQDETFDLAIIGGGINGAGMARDAALRGMKVLLVEQNDFASGTSSKSSKMIHGGIRYLENMEFHLVFEALSERQKLFEIAPHLVHPLRFMIPMFTSSKVSMNLMSLGMWAYDALSLFQAPEIHDRLDAVESSKFMPGLQEKDLLGSFVYYDAYMDDDRLVHETLRSAVNAGATCLNYCEALSPTLDQDGHVTKIKIADCLGQKTYEVQAKHFVSTVGPWTDVLGHKFFPSWKKMLRPTKGVHLTFERNKFHLPCAVVMGAEKRIVFAIPRHDMIIVGTTDTDYQGDPADVSATAEDVQYLMQVLHNYFPGLSVTTSDITAAYAGLRPLVDDGASTEGKTSREHSITTNENQVTFVAGGKYTTYRLISKQAVEHCLRFFSIEDRVKFNNCQTNTAINPLITQDSIDRHDEYSSYLKQNSKMPTAEVEGFVRRHSFEAIEIAKKFGLEFSSIELEALHAIYNTMCLNVLDFYARRVPLFLGKTDHGLSQLEKVCVVFQRELKLSNQEMKQQKDALMLYFQKESSWKKNIES